MSWELTTIQHQTDLSSRTMACSAEFPSMLRFSTLAGLHIFIIFFLGGERRNTPPPPNSPKEPQSYWSSIRIKLNVLDGTPRFTETIMLLCISIGTSSYKQYVQVVLLKAVHANGMVCALIMWLSLMIMYGPLQPRPTGKLEVTVFSCFPQRPAT